MMGVDSQLVCGTQCLLQVAVFTFSATTQHQPRCHPHLLSSMPTYTCCDGAMPTLRADGHEHGREAGAVAQHQPRRPGPPLASQHFKPQCRRLGPRQVHARLGRLLLLLMLLFLLLWCRGGIDCIWAACRCCCCRCRQCRCRRRRCSVRRCSVRRCCVCVRQRLRRTGCRCVRWLRR